MAYKARQKSYVWLSPLHVFPPIQGKTTYKKVLSVRDRMGL